MMGAPTSPSFAPIAAPAESLPRTPEELVAQLWERIGNALDGGWPPWALPLLATASPGGPRARVLALRSIEPVRRRFVFHTDARSDKVAELRHDPRASVVLWDPGDAIEARFTDTAEVHCEDAVAAAAWNGVSPLRRIASSVVERPGTALPQSLRLDALPAAASAATARANFAVICVTAFALDWLWLGPHDLRRVRARWSDDRMDAVWVVP